MPKRVDFLLNTLALACLLVVAVLFLSGVSVDATIASLITGR
ncbi:MAG TPA: hypothetical protein VFL95_09255 [Gemmatimonadales bacterium]|nr:hypothetical protein [Gemmatimonadales bacterium]